MADEGNDGFLCYKKGGTELAYSKIAANNGSLIYRAVPMNRLLIFGQIGNDDLLWSVSISFSDGQKGTVVCGFKSALDVNSVSLPRLIVEEGGEVAIKDWMFKGLSSGDEFTFEMALTITRGNWNYSTDGVNAPGRSGYPAGTIGNTSGTGGLFFTVSAFALDTAGNLIRKENPGVGTYETYINKLLSEALELTVGEGVDVITVTRKIKVVWRDEKDFDLSFASN